MEEKDAIFEIVNYSKKIKWEPGKTLTTGVAFFGGKNEFQQTVFGKRFIERIALLTTSSVTECDCVLCGQNPAPNGVICETCADNLAEDAEEYADSHFMRLINKGPAEKQPTADISGIKKAIVASDKYTENLINNLDASIDKLASKKAIRSINRMLTAILVVCLLNTISIITIAFIVFKVLETL